MGDMLECGNKFFVFVSFPFFTKFIDRYIDLIGDVPTTATQESRRSSYTH